MVEPLADRIIRRIGQAAELYHRLVILAGPAGSGKTAALQDVHERTAAPLINVNLELSKRMLDLTSRQRALQLPRLLAEIANTTGSDVVLLDNIEVLFDSSLKQDPLRRPVSIDMVQSNELMSWSCAGFPVSRHITSSTVCKDREKPARTGKGTMRSTYEQCNSIHMCYEGYTRVRISCIKFSEMKAMP